jgi:hypothetical protein|tara:strand:+ start:1304 stop:1450 length:147 start_codon:yes stop_codon:yes gene_type:complete
MKKIFNTIPSMLGKTLGSPALDYLKKLRERRHKQKLQRKKDERNKKMS